MKVVFRGIGLIWWATVKRLTQWLGFDVINNASYVQRAETIEKLLTLSCYRKVYSFTS